MYLAMNFKLLNTCHYDGKLVCGWREILRRWSYGRRDQGIFFSGVYVAMSDEEDRVLEDLGMDVKGLMTTADQFARLL